MSHKLIWWAAGKRAGQGDQGLQYGHLMCGGSQEGGAGGGVAALAEMWEPENGKKGPGPEKRR